jgi:DNA-binding NtrC family response regulator
LRQRRDDIPYLATRFLDITNAELSKVVKGFCPAAMDRMLAYEWPGNVRQLRSVIRRAVLVAEDIVTEQHLELEAGSLVEPDIHSAGHFSGDLPLRTIVRKNTMRVERDAITRTLQRVGGNKAMAARLLQVDYKTMHSKVKEYGIRTN